MTYRRVLLAVDLADDSSLLIGQRAREIAAALGANLEFMHVVPPVPLIAPVEPEPVLPVVLDTQQRLLEAAQERLSKLSAELGLPNARRTVEFGLIRTEILRVARERRADLIVLGNHERHGLAVLRHTEETVLHEAPCDVLAVRADAARS